jgi:hypothetical protein
VDGDGQESEHYFGAELWREGAGQQYHVAYIGEVVDDEE